MRPERAAGAAKPGHTYAELDGLRGVAALAVMVYHYSPFLAPATLLPGAYLAVDFFFILSGFVVEHAYRARLAARGALPGFLAVRLVRLYPLYLAGLGIGVLYVLAKSRLVPAEAAAPGDMVGAALLSALFLPVLRPAEQLAGLFPYNQAAWSLALELGVNLAFALAFRALTLARLAAVVAGAALWLLALALQSGHLDQGMTLATIRGGVARVTFGFFAGVLLHRLLAAGRLPRPRLPSGLLVAALLAILLAAPRGPGRAAFDLLAVLGALPALVWLGAGATSGPRLAAWHRQAGRLSYAVYILHGPLLLLVAGTGKAVLGIEPLAARPAGGLVLLGTTLLGSWIAVRFYDEPVRRRLARAMRARLAPRAAAEPART